VVEKPTGSLGFGGTYASTTGLGAEITFQEANFLGRGQALGLAISTAATNKKLEFSFREPAFLGRDLSAGIALSSAAYTPDDVSFQSNTTSFSPSVEFPLTEYSALNLSYNLSTSNVASGLATNAYISGVIRDEIAMGDVLNSSIGYEYTYDNRRKGLNTNSGALFQLGQEIGGFGGDNSFVKTNFKVIGQTTVMAEEVTLSATLEGGTMSFMKGSSRVNDRFSLGSSVMRGFDANGIGPREIKSGFLQ
jgi:outer membrane protein insertion porin family